MENDQFKSAFPSNESNYQNDYSDPGMTLRDFFAAKALPLAATDADGKQQGLWMETVDGIAVRAYKMADAMLRAREAS